MNAKDMIGMIIDTELGPQKVVSAEWGAIVTEPCDWGQLEQLPLNGETEAASQDPLITTVAAVEGMIKITNDRRVA